MKKLASICSVFVFLAAPAFADLMVGDRIRLFDGPGSPGGEFGVAKYPNTATQLFVTFCVERTEYLDFNVNGFYVDSITNRAIQGSVGPSGDPISSQTAWLYTQFRQGTLTGYNGTEASANSLQKAIWILEGETGGGDDTQAIAWRNAATAAVNGGWGGPTGLGNVRVANLVWATTRSGYTAGSRAQDILILVPAPGVALLMALGVGLVGWFKRRLA